MLLQVVEMRDVVGRKISSSIVLFRWSFRQRRVDHAFRQLFLGSHRAAGPVGQLSFQNGCGFAVVSLNPGHLVVVRLAFHGHGRRRLHGRFRRLGLSSAVVVETRGTSLRRRGSFGLFRGFRLLWRLRQLRLLRLVVVVVVVVAVADGEVGCRCLEVLDGLGVEFWPRLTSVCAVQAAAKKKSWTNGFNYIN